MADREFQTLSVQSQRDALITAERASNQNAFLLEKDIWVVATLRALFNASFGEHLIFKGGTSLSKVWGAIHRFSEDIDITYDIRSLEPALISQVGGSVSQQRVVR